MKYLIHDYCGHPFQVDLSRQLSQRGHDVSHLYYADNPGPKGMLETRPGDTGLRFIGITLGDQAKAAGTGAIGFGRFVKEFTYGRKAADVIRQIKPDVVICGNTPPNAQRAIIRACKQQEICFIYWLQDIYSVAVSTLLAKKLGNIGKAIGWYYQQLERRQFRSSDGIVVISPDFIRLIAPLAPQTPISVIENWAAISDLPVLAKDNDWSRAHNLQGFTYLYSGTLGRKHNPLFLAKLAEQSSDTVAVVAQGYGVPLLTEAQQGLKSLRLFPLQPAARLAEVLASADVLLATIEAEAGIFAVPSKVLSYLCAGRPILLAAPESNLAARIVTRANAGIVVAPDDETGFLAAAHRLRADPQLCAELGANGRQYAERTFDIESITDDFQRFLSNIVRPVTRPQTIAITAK